jgi:hypothetical protein
VSAAPARAALAALLAALAPTAGASAQPQQPAPQQPMPKQPVPQQPAPAQDAAPAVPLLAAVQRLECGPPEQAAAALAELRALVDPQLGVPLERPGGAQVRAAVLDIALAGLAAAAHRHPGLREGLTAEVARFNPCLVRAEGALWDVVRSGEGPRRLRPAAPLPLGGEGFRAWGLGPDGPGAAALAGAPPAGERCAGGGGGGLYQYAGQVPSGPLRFDPEAPGVLAGVRAPPGSTSCTAPPPPVVAAVAPAAQGTGAPPEGTPGQATPGQGAPGQGAPGQATPGQGAAGQGAAGLGAAGQGAPSQGAGGEGEPSVPAVAVAGIPQGAGAVGATPRAQATRRKLLFGQAFFTHRLPGVTELGAGATFAPVPYGFVRASVAWPLLQEFRYAPAGLKASWGVGYDDWHPGTLSVQLNNWGPIERTEQLWLGSEFDVGYKLPFGPEWARYVGVLAHAFYQVGGAPGVGVTATVRPWQMFFLSSGVRYSLREQDAFTWFYTFGWSDWRPFTFSASYANWGLNRVPEPNFVRNGLLNLSFSWEL